VIDGACLNEEANVRTAYLINWRAIIDSDAEKEDGKNARAGNAESREFRFL
jgi:hypothetical protein